MFNRTLTAFLAISAAALVGCSEPEPGGAAETPAAAPEARRAAPQAQQSEERPRGDCDLLTTDEIHQAFGGALNVRRISGHGERGRGCTVSLVEGQDGQLGFQAGNREGFEALKEAYQAQSGISFEAVDVGVEGYLVNQAQIIAVDANGQSINMGLTLFVMGGEVPVDPAQASSGLQLLARTALSRY